MASLTGTTRRGSAFSCDSSLSSSKRVKRACQSRRKLRARSIASRVPPAGPSRITNASQVEPKQSNRARVSINVSVCSGAARAIAPRLRAGYGLRG